MFQNVSVRVTKDILLIAPKLSFFDKLCFFYQSSFLVIMTNTSMANSTLKRFEVPECFGSIHLWPHETILWSFQVDSEKKAKKLFRVTEPKNHNLLSSFKQIIWSFKYVILVPVHCVKSVHIRSFFWSVFSRIQTEYTEIQSIPPFSVRMRENTDQKKLRIWTLFMQWLILKHVKPEYFLK